ncbi:Acetyltransferase ataH [Colletotrichum orbiculare MAFF 240422]|uniref:Acetyltransferase ataH n=1 Tax=Colletotrichum orbiculare (strain 104-T / ATCC 96160 / CBS 514.97 / LARS 414 / MAFF 240422) TaxID=1213857 RepID=A0A484FG89_COLOR|nr:Acetyltransferase ataH [Colletotrichum orbiculare MAFF 240422]
MDWDMLAEGQLPSDVLTWDSLSYPVSIYLVGLCCHAMAINSDERYRVPLVLAFVAIGLELERYISGMQLSYALKDTPLKFVAVHVMGSVIMVLWEKLVLTEEQKGLPWRARLRATYKTMWNGRFINTTRQAPVYHLLRGQESRELISRDEDEPMAEAAATKEESIAERYATVPNETAEESPEGTGNILPDIRVSDEGAILNATPPNGTRIDDSPIGFLKPRSRWLIHSALHLGLLFVLDAIIQGVFARYGSYSIEAVTLDKTVSIRRLLRNKVAAEEWTARSQYAFEAYWAAYNWYTRLHLACALFFVGTGVDDPDEWPPAFGDVGEAYTLRRFWSKYYDRLIYRTVSGWGEIIMRGVGMGPRPYRRWKRWMLNGVIFLVSGVFHAQTDYLAGFGCGYWEEVAWWMYNFFAICGEAVFLAAFERWCPRFYGAMSGRAGRALGYLWVFAFHFWSKPKQQYVAIWCPSRF